MILLAEQSSACHPQGHAVLLHTDRATIALFAGEDKTYHDHLQMARMAADSFDWKDEGESRTALLVLAQLVAPKMPEVGWSYVERYTEIKTAVTPILSFGSGDQRLHALEQYTAGVVYRYNGKRDEAIDAFKEALRIWRPAKYHWRSALAAFHLGEITGA